MPEREKKTRTEKNRKYRFKEMFIENYMDESFVMQRTESRAPGGLHKAMIIKFLNYSNTDKLLQLARLNKSLIYNSDKYCYSLIAV